MPVTASGATREFTVAPDDEAASLTLGQRLLGRHLEIEFQQAAPRSYCHTRSVAAMIRAILDQAEPFSPHAGSK